MIIKWHSSSVRRSIISCQFELSTKNIYRRDYPCLASIPEAAEWLLGKASTDGRMLREDCHTLVDNAQDSQLSINIRTPMPERLDPNAPIATLATARCSEVSEDQPSASDLYVRNRRLIVHREADLRVCTARRQQGPLSPTSGVQCQRLAPCWPLCCRDDRVVPRLMV